MHSVGQRLRSVISGRSSRPTPADALIPLALALGATAEALSAGYGSVVPIWLAAATLWCGRPLPLLVLPTTASIYALAPLSGYNAADSGGMLPLVLYAAFLLGLYLPSQRWRGALGALLAGNLIAPAGLILFTTFEPNLVFGPVATGAPWLLGASLRAALGRAHHAAAAAEASRLDALDAARAAAHGERERLAAELHDALAHSLGEMVIGASVARDTLATAPAAASRQMTVVAGTGRAGIVEAGRLLQLLRRPDATAADADDGAAPALAAQDPRPGGWRRDMRLPGILGLGYAAEVLLSGPQSAPFIAAGSLATVWLCLRRSYPLATAPLVLASLELVRLGEPGVEEPVMTLLLAITATFATGRYPPIRRWPLGLLSVTVAVLIATAAEHPATLEPDPFTCFAIVLPWLAGLSFRRALDRACADGAATARARRLAARTRALAAGAERRRISRELHDVLAASLSVMTVQAELAAQLAPAHPEPATAAIETVHAAGSRALGEIGALLKAEAASDSTLHPQHLLSDLPALAAEFEQSGLGVRLVIDDTIHALPLGLELSLYRIVQEGLANALKHAPGSTVTVVVGRAAGGIDVEVRSAASPGGSRAARLPRSGGGLVGLRERVALFGGDLHAGPTGDGGFVVRALMPDLGAGAA